jgi:hypothetical protein
MLAGREQDLSVVAEVDSAPVVLGIGDFRILIDDKFAARDSTT